MLDQPGCFAQFCYDEHYQSDGSNWWVPTVACLNQWITASAFDVVHEFAPWSYAAQTNRHTVLAKATERTDPHYTRPDELLSAYLTAPQSPDAPLD